MAGYIKSYSNYVKTTKHQLVNDGKIFERDWVTIGGTNKYTAGQNPKFAEQNFIITIRNGLFGGRKHNFGKWIQNCENTSDKWTLEDLESCGISADDDTNELQLTCDSEDMLDYAYFGSCSELIRASIEHIIRFFPGELYFGENRQEYLNNGNYEYINGWIVDNPFLIDLFTKQIHLSEVENPLRYFCESYDKYEVIINGSSHKVTSFSSTTPSGVDPNCYVEGQVIKNITIGYEGGSLQFTMNYAYGNKVLIYTNSSYTGFHVRPNQDEIDNFFEKKLDCFEKLLLDRSSVPLYQHEWITPVETKYGVTFVRRKYQWPVQNGWNIDISSIPYASFVNSLLKVASYYDEYYSDNLYRMITHEAIKNFDWSFTREYQEGDEEEYVIGGTKIKNLMRVYGMGFDEIKRYADGITFSNVISYNNFNNINSSLIPDKLEEQGWVIYSTIDIGNDNVKTDPLYPTENEGYDFKEANNIFMRNLYLNSKAILRTKGTKKSIEMIMALFGIDRDWYSLHEYVYTVTPKTDSIDTIIELNKNKLIDRVDWDDDFEGLMVKEVYDLTPDNQKTNRALYPWCSSRKKYDGGVVFQSKGGWGLHNENGGVAYRESCNYTNVVETTDELVTLPVNSVQAGDVYYVINSDYGSNYFKLASDEGLRVIGGNGWNTLSEDDPEVQYLSSIIDDERGNKPHVGFGMYDGGQEYLEYLKTIFKYAIDHNKFTVEDLATAQGVGGFSINGPIEDNKKTWANFQTTGGDTVSYKGNRTYNNPLRQTSYSISQGNDTLNVKRFVIRNELGNAEFSRYFVNHILPYIEQVLPATVIYELENFDAGFTGGGTGGSGSGDFISLDKNIVYLNDNKTSETVTLTASDDWSQKTNSQYADITPSSGGETSGTPLDVKKKSGYGVEKIRYCLDKSGTICTTLTVRVSMIQITPETWEFPPEGGTKVFDVVVDGHAAASNEYTYVCTFPNATVVKNGSQLIVTVPASNGNEPITGEIIVTHAFDSSCTDSSSLSQEGNDISITATPENYNFDVEGGEFTFTVTALGGSEDYTYSIPNNSWLTFVSKDGDQFTVKARPNYTATDSTPVTITFYHKDDSDVNCTVEVTQTADNNLSIDVNPKTVELEYKASTNKNCAVLTVEGGSKAYTYDPSTIPSWCQLTTNGYDLTIVVTENKGTEERTCDITFYHADDNTVSTVLTVIQSTSGELKIEVEPTEYTFPYYESKKSFTVRVYGGSKKYTSVNDGDWFKVSKATGEDFGEYQEYTITVTASENKTDAERTGTITCYHADNVGLSAVINLTQEKPEGEAINVEDKDGSIVTEIGDIPCEGYANGEEYRLKVVVTPEGTSFTVKSYPSWMSYDKISVIGENYLQLYFQPNPELEDRTGNLVIQHGTNPSITKTITITQLACEPIDLLINDKKEETWEVEPEGGTQSFTMTVTGGSKKYIIPRLTETWLKVNISGETDSDTIEVTVEAQPEITLGDRTYTIVFTHKDDENVTCSLTITQKEGLSITKSPDEDMIHVPAAGETKIYTIIPKGGSGQSELFSNTCDEFVSVVKNNNKVTIIVRENLESEPRECDVCFNHADDKSLTTCIHIQQDGFEASINIETEKPKVLEVCAFEGISGCGILNEDCDECTSYCENGSQQPQTNRTFTTKYDVTVMGGSGDWKFKGFAEASCCDEEGAECTENLVECDWVRVDNVAGQLELTIDENKELCSNEDPECGEVNKGKEREICVVIQHADKDTIVDKIKIKQKAPVVAYRNYKISVQPDAIRIPARSEDLVVGEGMDAKYYKLDDLVVTSTKEKYINCAYDKTIYVPWNATTDCTDPILTLPCELRLDGEVIKGKLTKVIYQQFGYEGGNGSVQVFSTEPWTAEVTAGSDFVTLGTTSGSSGTTSNLTFSVSKNETCVGRTGAIKIKSCLNDDTGAYKEVNIEIPQEMGHICTLNVWPIHPIPDKIPEEGGIYKYRVASYDCDKPVPWTVEASGCEVNCIAGYDGGTESVGLTVKVPPSEGGAVNNVSINIVQNGNDSCELQTGSIDGIQGGNDRPEGNCECCKCHIHTPTPIHSLPATGISFNEYVVYACNECVPKDWEVYCKDNNGQWPDWVHWSKTSGSGRCNDDLYDCDIFNAQAVVDAGRAEVLTVRIDPNTTGAERQCNWGYRLVGEDCGGYDAEYFKQSADEGGGEEPECPDGKYVLFADSRIVYDMEATGGRLSNEKINRYCIDVESFDVKITGGDTTNNVEISPASGAIDATNITVGENNSTKERKIVITIHPHDGEKVDAPGTASTLSTLSVIDEESVEGIEPLPTYRKKPKKDNKVYVNGQIYADYTDGNLTFVTPKSDVVVYTVSTVDRIQYDPDQTEITNTDEYGDSSDPIDGDNVELTFGENREPIEKNCSIFFEQKEENEYGEKQKAEYVIWQDPAVIEYKDYKFAACPMTLTVGADGGTLVASMLSTANKYINDIKREENVPVDYYCDCFGEESVSGEGPVSEGNTGSTENLNPDKPSGGGGGGEGGGGEDPEPEPGGDSGNPTDPDWAGKCRMAGYDGGGPQIGTVDAVTQCCNGTHTCIKFTFNPRLTGDQKVKIKFNICDKCDGGYPSAWTTKEITPDTQDDLYLNYSMDHCNNWWPIIQIQTEGWYRGTIQSGGPYDPAATCDNFVPASLDAMSFQEKMTLAKQNRAYSRAGADWATIDCATNIITVQPNDDYINDRMTSFMFIQEGSNLYQTVIVFQKRKERTFSYNILTEPLMLHFDLTGGTEYLDVQSYMLENLSGVEQPKISNLGYTVVGTERWCTIDPKTNVVTCEPNEDGLESRSMTFIFTQDKSGINHTVLVEQGEQLKYVFEVVPASLTFEAAGGTQSVVVTSEIIPIIDEEEQEAREMGYEVTGGTDWCSFNAEGTSVTCTENVDKENARVTLLTYTQEKTGLKHHLLVFQKKPDILPELYAYIDAQDQKLQVQIDELKGKVSDIEGDINDMQSDISNIEGDINNLEGDINNLSSSISNLSGDISSLQSSISNLSSSISSINSSISSINSDISYIMDNCCNDTGGTTPANCVFKLYTPDNVGNVWNYNFPMSGGTATFYVVQSCDTDGETATAKSWSVNSVDVGTLSGTLSGTGPCCDTYEDNESTNFGGCLADATEFNVAIPANTGANRAITVSVDNECEGTTEAVIYQAGEDKMEPGCEFEVHTPSGYHNIDYKGYKFRTYVCISAYYDEDENCSIRPWTAVSNCDWLTIECFGTEGYCCDEFDRSYKMSKLNCSGSTTAYFDITVAPNETTERRSCKVDIYQTGDGCNISYSIENIQQANPGTTGETGCTECYVLFENARTVNADASGITLKDEGIVPHGNGDNCKAVTKNFTIVPDNIGVKVNPSSGDIDACTITVPENPSTEQRTITITIHPHDGEASTANCVNDSTKALSVTDETPSVAVNASKTDDELLKKLQPAPLFKKDTRMIVNGEIYSDYDGYYAKIPSFTVDIPKNYGRRRVINVSVEIDGKKVEHKVYQQGIEDVE